MDSLRLEKSSIKLVFPESGVLLDKLTADVKTDLEELIDSQLELLEVIRQTHTQLYHIMRGCLRIEPQARYKLLTAGR